MNIPFDSLFEDAEDIIFASSFSSETGSQDLFKQRQQPIVERSELLSGQVSISARAASTAFVAMKENAISEIEVKDLAKPIKIEIPLNKAVQSAETTQCMFLNERLNQWQALDSECEPA